VLTPGKVSQSAQLFLKQLFAGTRFQAAGHKDKEKDVVSEHEDKTDVCHHR